MKTNIFRRFIGLIITLSIMMSFIPMHTAYANAPYGIYNNGLGGISIDINAAPYTTFAGYSYGKYAYTTSGCAWFASARVNHLTGRGSTIWDAYNWYYGKGSALGFSTDKTPQSYSIACYKTDHNTYHCVIIEKIEGDTAYLSECGSSVGANYGHALIHTKKVSELAHLYGYALLGYVHFGSAIINPPNIHTHSWTYHNESAHTHREYRTCSCGEKQYTGKTKLVSTCSQCYPLGNVNLTRSFNRVSRNATFYRNNVANANSYTLTLYKDGASSSYGTYNMSSTEKTVSSLASGTYTATLTAKNTSTNQTKTASALSFTIVDTYDVVFDANGGANAPSAQTKIKDEDLTLTSAEPKRVHYIFKGWAANKNETEPQYLAGDTYAKNTRITLYAVWEPETYTINFDVNGGKGEVESAAITYGNTMKMPNTIVRDGYYLKGWSKTKGATTPDYKLGLDHMLDSNMTLYAVWGQSTWGGTVATEFAGGDGTEENPYQISNAAELAHLADKVNNQQSEPKYEYYILTDNIDLGYKEWLPIGLYENENQYFKGSFNGNGYTISDIYISDSSYGKAGLFGLVNDSELFDFTISGAMENISSDSEISIGSVAGCIENTNINKCNVMYFNIANISVGTKEYSAVGCLVGKTENGSIKDSNATDCAINIKSGKYDIGTLIGRCSSDLDNCSVIATESGLFSNTTATGSMHIGGLCGYMTANTVRCSVKAPYLSNVINMTESTYAGGLFGYVTGNVKICSCEFTDGETKNIDGDVYRSSIFASGTGRSVIGGIAGYAASDADIEDCKYEGQSVAITTTSGTIDVGGLTGKTNGNILRSFVNAEDNIFYGTADRNVNVGGLSGTAVKPSLESIQIGDYLELGTYYNEPILWRCVDIDENGPLMLSDKIICLKAYDANGTNTSGSHGRGYYSNSHSKQGYYRQKNGSDYWGDSNLRSWLNSESNIVTWACGNPPSSSHVTYNAYDTEAGFLANFSSNEKALIKSVSQKSILNAYEASGSDNTKNSNYFVFNGNIASILQNYNTAYSEKRTDKMFLLDVKQVNTVYNNRAILGDSYYIGEVSEQATVNSDYPIHSKAHYWLRTPRGDGIGGTGLGDLTRTVNTDGSVDAWNASNGNCGVRPAFYLDISSSTQTIGEGTEETPYILSETSKNPEASAIAVAKKLSAKVTGNSYYARAGYLVGNVQNEYTFNTSYYDSATELSAVNSSSSSKVAINDTGTARATRLMKISSFLTNQLGLKPYSSLKNTLDDETAVWVIKDGEYPELYFTVLNDITVSDVEHGTISVDKTQAVDDEIVTVTAVPDEGYKLNKIYVNGEEITGTTFTVAGDSDVYATFAEIPAEYRISVAANANASAGLVNVDDTTNTMSLQSISLFSDNSELSATDGKEIKVNTQAAADYTVDAIYVNGEELAGDSFIVTDDSIVTMDAVSISTNIEATTYNATEIYSYTATLGGYVEDNEGITRYIRYWKTETPEEVMTSETEEGGGEYSVVVDNLEAGIEYSYQMCDTGEVKTFTTAEEKPIGTEIYGQEVTPTTEPTEEPIQREICFEIQNDAINNNAVTADIVNISEEIQSGLVIFASYDNSNALVKVETQDIENLEANGIFPIEFDLPEGADKYKILVWDSWKTMLPIATSVHNE